MATKDCETPAWTAPRQSIGLTAFKVAGVAVSTLLLATLFVRTFVAIGIGEFAWLALPAFVLGYLAADLASGSAHWFCDTFFEVDTPVIGQVLMQPFREHHDHPSRITGYRFIEQDTTNFFLMLPLLAVAFWLEAPRPGDGGALLGWCGVLGLAAGLFGTNLFHRWAHEPEPPVAVRWLQRSGLILSPERHRHHHRDHSHGFCVTSGWMNPLLDALSFFPRVEQMVRFFQR